MKTLKDVILEKLDINEKLIINKNIKFKKYKYHPEDKDELKNLIKELIFDRGNKADLNDIDTSKITDMSYLFGQNNDQSDKCWEFNGDISEWDVKNVKNMKGMFNLSHFTGENGDLSNWDVSNVEDMSYMFNFYEGGDKIKISKWDVSNVTNMCRMFSGSNFKCDISKWDVSHVNNMGYMFHGSKFNGDISNWNVSKVKYMLHMFEESPLEKNPPKWYKINNKRYKR